MDIDFKIDLDHGLHQEQYYPVHQKKSPFETCWSLTEDVGSGKIKKIEPRPGFVIFIADYVLKEAMITSVASNESAVGFGFLLSGNGWARAHTVPYWGSYREGKNSVLYYPDQNGTMKDMKNSRRQSISLLVEPELFNRLLKGNLDGIPKTFKAHLDGSNLTGGYTQNSWITSLMYQALEPFFRCPFTGSTRLLLLESKAMELIALSMSQLMEVKKNQSLVPQLGTLDIQKVHHVADRLRLDLENPPTLFDLAASEGISHAKLNRGFRKIFGTTVFGYLRTLRLHKAKQLLEQGQLNVTETAMAVGYSSLSSFARAFFTQYGTTPNLCMRKKSRTPHKSA
jgi:AraC-like DNA-binding protein